MPIGTRPAGVGGPAVSGSGLQFDVPLRNARLDVVESHVGTAPILRIYSGGKPDLTTDPSTGTLLAAITLPSDWMDAASGAVKEMLGSWAVAAVGSGLAGYFRLYESTGTTVKIQGTVTGTGSGGQLQVDDPNCSAGETVTVTLFTLTEGNA